MTKNASMASLHTAPRPPYLKIVLFGGTTEGRELGEFCAAQGIPTRYCVATYDGTRDLERRGDTDRGVPATRYHVDTYEQTHAPKPWDDIHIGRLDANGMESLFAEYEPTLVIDATHPYALEVSKNIALACGNTGLPLLRIDREAGAEYGEGCLSFTNSDELLAWLERQEGNVFVSTGSSQAKLFSQLTNFRERVWIRVLPVTASIETCIDEGFRIDHIIAMQGPFSQALNRAMFESSGARILVTKNSGSVGGFDEKVKAARSLGMTTAILSRAEETDGVSLEEAKERIRAYVSDCGTVAGVEDDSVLQLGTNAAIKTGLGSTPHTDRDAGCVKKTVSVVGMGLGAPSLSAEAKQAIESAEVLIGDKRMLEVAAEVSPGSKLCFDCYHASHIADFIDDMRETSFAVLVSGDTGFYSTATGLAAALSEHELSFIPGISSMNAFFARLKLPWQNAAFVSAHGRDVDLVGTVRRNRLTFCLTGNNVAKIGAALCGAGFGGLTVQVGENLGGDLERISVTTAEELTRSEYPSLTVLLFVNENADASTPTGLADECFARRETIPMTKSEIRAIVISKLRLHPDAVCWDVGAGSGSVSVEMALSAYRGSVYAVERLELARPLIEENCAARCLGNVRVVCGEAPAALEPLPAPDAVFIGGSSGNMADIIKVAVEKNPRVRIVVTAITLETVPAAMEAMTQLDLEPEIVQVNVARAEQVGRFHLMKAQNPVTILSAGGII